MPELIQILPPDVPRTWPNLVDRVDYGLERSDGRMTREGLYARALSGEWDLHVVYLVDDDEAGGAPHGAERVRAVLLTQNYDELSGVRICAMRFLAGIHRVEWVWLVEALELWAARNGCDRMEILARRGWLRDLKEYGYRQTHILLEKTLKGEPDGLIGSQADRHHVAHAASGDAGPDQPDRDQRIDAA